MKKLIAFVCILQLFTTSFAQDKVPAAPGAFKDFALPSDLEGIKKEPGSLYYSSSTKGKVLIPVNVWGEVNKSGLHFVPVDTNLIQGLSLAGGPKSSGVLNNVKLTRNVEGKIEEFTFDLEKGGNIEAYQLKLNPGDTIFVEKEYFYENRAYYTGLIAVVATILSSVILYRQIKKDR